MTDLEALTAAIVAEPDEDTPRLVLADYLEENGQADRAVFVRAQVELARTPAWEPFAAYCRWRRPDWVAGRPFRDTLPAVGEFHVEWPDEPFRRGLGWFLNIRSLIAWERVAGRVLARAPVGAVRLWGAALLDEWREFAASPLVPRLRRVHLAVSPNEPLRALRDAPAAAGIADVSFERTSGAGMSFVVEELLAAPLGRRLRGLHFRLGGESRDDVIDALHAGEPTLERLSLAGMGLTHAPAHRLMTGPAVRHLTELDLRDNPLGTSGAWDVAHDLPASVRSLNLSGTGAGGAAIDELVLRGRNLRRVDLGNNPLTPRAARSLARAADLAGLRSLGLRRCRVGERELYHLARAKFWPNLVELDLRDNPIPSAGVRHLLDAPVPPDLTALVLDGHRLGGEARRDLLRKFGDAVVFRSDTGT
jgi:uncharacterized protein (TIGR02996 family)